MCKYCKIRSASDIEKLNDGQVIGRIRDGRQEFEVSLFRYIYNDRSGGDLSLTYSFKNDEGGYTPIDGKEIPIKYCPFCGEKL